MFEAWLVMILMWGFLHRKSMIRLFKAVHLNVIISSSIITLAVLHVLVNCCEFPGVLRLLFWVGLSGTKNDISHSFV